MTVTIFFQDCSYLVVPPSRLAQPWQGLLAQWYAFAESHAFDARRRGRKKEKKKKREEKKERKRGRVSRTWCSVLLPRQNGQQDYQTLYSRCKKGTCRDSWISWEVTFLFSASCWSFTWVRWVTGTGPYKLNKITLLRLTKCTCSTW